eukprot:CAMPEP_0176013766 /NCGR_PEP_ID=MMETSP0120_2-20121206/6476_1 /TAXON_ID=160619 /ORGANISM="Kryptoperidinium foliaceum, Strain CCMP 1326" /LENGTH=377 /DNA_ID=CAMNT_0017346685 /DNA_START=47 /DNA_END=1178 /DNA_ORIENTATION=+
MAFTEQVFEKTLVASSSEFDEAFMVCEDCYEQDEPLCIPCGDFFVLGYCPEGDACTGCHKDCFECQQEAQLQERSRLTVAQSVLQAAGRAAIECIERCDYLRTGDFPRGRRCERCHHDCAVCQCEQQVNEAVNISSSWTAKAIRTHKDCPGPLATGMDEHVAELYGLVALSQSCQMSPAKCVPCHAYAAGKCLWGDLCTACHQDCVVCQQEAQFQERANILSAAFSLRSPLHAAALRPDLADMTDIDDLSELTEDDGEQDESSVYEAWARGKRSQTSTADSAPTMQPLTVEELHSESVAGLGHCAGLIAGELPSTSGHPTCLQCAPVAMFGFERTAPHVSASPASASQCALLCAPVALWPEPRGHMPQPAWALAACQ